MCSICSRRGFLAAGLGLVAAGLTPHGSAGQTNLIGCGLSNNDFDRARRSMRSTPGGDDRFHRPLVGELDNIIKLMKVDPGFQYVDARNAFAVSDSFVAGFKGTVLIGVELVRELLEPDDGGISVAGVLAHECAHIFQFFSGYAQSLRGQTPVRVELHADVLAGYYLATKVGSAGGRLAVMQRELIKHGTYNPQNPNYHGTPGQRNAALDEGYTLARNGVTFEDAAKEAADFVKVLVRHR